jgi:hypothetical protein
MTIEMPPELFAEWWAEGVKQHGFGHNGLAAGLVARKAAEWAADQQLEKCCEWASNYSARIGTELRAAMRPKPPSLKEQATMALSGLISGLIEYTEDQSVNAATIRRAIESIPDAES